MKINVKWSRKDIETIKNLWSKHQGSSNQKWISRLNLRYPWKRPTDATIWDTRVTCILSSVQPAGPRSSIATLFGAIGSTNFPVGLSQIVRASDPLSFLCKTLRERGFRAWDRRANMIWDNYQRFVKMKRCTIIEASASDLISVRAGRSASSGDDLLRRERGAAAKIMWDKKLKVAGMGPKQSRHLLKQVGLGSETVVIDSRLMRFLWSVLESPDEAGPYQLTEEHTYRMVENWFRILARHVGIAPIQLETLLWEVYTYNKSVS
jgi:thermostable 8-oxoguanine DNA glycosylase